MSTKEENFEMAFDLRVGSCTGICACGQQFYNDDPFWGFEEGEISELKKNGAIRLEHSVSFVGFEGHDYVYDCGCWKERSKKILVFIDSHVNQIAEYINLEKARKTQESKNLASSLPEVNLDEK